MIFVYHLRMRFGGSFLDFAYETVEKPASERLMENVH
jgi:hypothetical protein